MSWKELAKCTPTDTHLFFSSDPKEQKKAKTICQTCPVKAQCLNHAIVTNQHGIWGTTTDTQRKWIHRKHKEGPTQYREAINQQLQQTRPHQPQHPCPNCNATTPPGQHPINRNGPNANCGKPSTYNNGCRCPPCVKAKADHDSQQNHTP